MESILSAFPSIRESISIQNSKAPRINHPGADGTDSSDVDFSFGVSVVETVQNHAAVDKTDTGDITGFSFGVLAGDDHNKSTSDVTADEIFHHGRIVPLCSVTQSSRNVTDTETDTDEIFLGVARTAPGSPIKSWSTGSTRKTDTIRELLFKGRSLSDGKEKLGFVKKGNLIGNSKNKKNKKKEKEEKRRRDLVNSNKMDYAENGEKGIVMKSTRRRPLLAYIGLIGTGLQSFTKKLFF